MRASSRGGGSVLLLIVLLVVGVVIGAVAASLLQPFSWAGFLTRTVSFGVGDNQPLTLDLSVLRLSFGLGLRINLTEALGLLGAVLLYRRLR